jgi:hypothetical protein
MNKEVVVTTKTIILLNLTRNKRYTNEDMKNELSQPRPEFAK